MTLRTIITFIIGYLAITLEHNIKINIAETALVGKSDLVSIFKENNLARCINNIAEIKIVPAVCK